MFPGQGTQQAGMARMLIRSYPFVRNIFEIGSETAGYDLLRLCLDEPDEILGRTEYTQMAVTAMNMAWLEVARRLFEPPVLVCGHSLGHLSALCAAGVLTLGDLFALIKKRTELMLFYGKPGVLHTIVGLPPETVSRICRQTDPQAVRVWPALYNSVNQVVIGGEPQAVRETAVLAIHSGASKTIETKVSAPFHTPYFRQMEGEYRQYLQQIDMKPPLVPVLGSCTAAVLPETGMIREDLIMQCSHPVCWFENMKLALTKGDVFIETGYGHTLAGLLRSVIRDRPDGRRFRIVAVSEAKPGIRRAGSAGWKG